MAGTHEWAERGLYFVITLCLETDNVVCLVLAYSCAVATTGHGSCSFDGAGLEAGIVLT